MYVKSWIASLTQTGTDAPTATVLYNGLNAEPTITRIGAGQYLFTWPVGTFNETAYSDRVQLIAIGRSLETISGSYDGTDRVQINSIMAGTESDGLLLKTVVQINVYTIN